VDPTLGTKLGPGLSPGPSHLTLASSGFHQGEYGDGSERGGKGRRTPPGKYAGYRGTIASDVFQRTVDYPEDLANGHHVMLDTEELVTVRCDQVASTVPQRVP